MSLGTRIAKARKARGLTQEQLADQLQISFQAVSTWERDECLPDTNHLLALSKALGCALDDLFSEEEKPDWPLRSRVFNEERMYTFVSAQARALGLEQTAKALPFMRDKHAGQFRKGAEMVPYMIHPLTMACHALAMGIREDDALAALLLHDVVEDTDTALEALPVSGRVREAVRLVSWNSYDLPEPEIDDAYYGNIAKNPLACLVKCIDRCNNLCGMADAFSKKKMAGYVLSTEKHVLPLLEVIKGVPAWNSAAWLLRYQITGLLETFKRLL